MTIIIIIILKLAHFGPQNLNIIMQNMPFSFFLNVH